MMMNREIFLWIHAGAGNRPVLDFLSVSAAEITPYLVIVCMAVFWFSTDERGKRVLLEAAAAVVAGLIINQLIGLFYYHPRPFMVGLCRPLIPHAPENSFPSDHATLLFAASLSLLWHRKWRRQGGLLLILALSGAWGRIYTGVHFPYDIAGSFLVSLFSILVVTLSRRGLTPFYHIIIGLVDGVEGLILGKYNV